MIIEALLAKMKKLCYESGFFGQDLWILNIKKRRFGVDYFEMKKISAS